MRPGTNGDLDAVLNPLLQGTHGRTLEDGITNALETSFAFENGHFAGGASPRAHIGVAEGDDGPNIEFDVPMAYARAVAGPFALDVGRIEVTWGFGTERGVAMSSNVPTTCSFRT